MSHAQALVVDFAVVLWAKMRIRLISPATKVTRAVYTFLRIVLLMQMKKNQENIFGDFGT